VVADSARAKGDVISDAFYGACRNGHTDVADLFLGRGADVNAKGILGGTGLHSAAINGHKETVAFLLAYGADLTIRDVTWAVLSFLNAESHAANVTSYLPKNHRVPALVTRSFLEIGICGFKPPKIR
jgi:ankyrin repeat protein